MDSSEISTQSHVPEQRPYIVVYGGDVAAVCRQGPGVLAVKVDIFRQQLIHGLALRDHKGPDPFLVLDFLLPGPRLRYGFVGFTFLTLVSVRVDIAVNNAVAVQKVPVTIKNP